MSTYRILSMDGGPGGVTYVRVLQAIERERIGQDLHDGTDPLGKLLDGLELATAHRGRPPVRRAIALDEECQDHAPKIGDRSAARLRSGGGLRLTGGRRGPG